MYLQVLPLLLIWVILTLRQIIIASCCGLCCMGWDMLVGSAAEGAADVAPKGPVACELMYTR